jgi:putative glutamine amidotransferase
LASILNTTELKVNSLHHQAVDELAPPLRISAVSEDGIVEAVEAPQARFFLGVQWHPEWMVQQTPIQNLFRAFVAACEEYARQKTI